MPQIEPDRVDVATVFFSDIVGKLSHGSRYSVTLTLLSHPGFTQLASAMSPDQVSDMLDRLYLKFDALTFKHDIFKMETIVSARMTLSYAVALTHIASSGRRLYVRVIPCDASKT